MYAADHEHDAHTVTMHACTPLKRKDYFNNGLVAGVASLSFVYYIAFVRKQCSADYSILHDYHSMDSSWSHAKVLR